MEINAVLDRHVLAKSGLWYVLSPENEGPSARVGHTSCVLKTSASILKDCPVDSPNSDSLLIIGGANPDGAFDDVFVLDFEQYKWFKCHWQGLPKRYEHSAFIPEHTSSEVVVYGGAQMDRNLNDVQVLDTDAKSWCLSVPSGEAPSQRTCHSAAAIGNRLFIFGGGQSGAKPVKDDKLYVYNAKENCWYQPVVNGQSPKVRHGHVMIAVRDAIYVHGGMAGTEILGDLWKLITDDGEMSWSQPTVNGDIPSKRAAHAGCAVDGTLYLFGGMNETGALDDLYALNTETMLWQKIQCDGPPPHCRLDHTMSAVTVSRKVDDDEEKTVDQTFLVVFGGMDTSGQIFDDCLAFLVKE